MTSAVLAPATPGDGLTYQDALIDMVERARSGDIDALIYVFDNVFFDVYQHVFLVTRDRRRADRLTRKALDRLPSMLRSRRYRSLSQLRAALLDQAGRSMPQSKVKASPGGMAGLRAVTRHLVLISASAITTAGALILAI